MQELIIPALFLLSGLTLLAVAGIPSVPRAYHGGAGAWLLIGLGVVFSPLVEKSGRILAADPGLIGPALVSIWPAYLVLLAAVLAHLHFVGKPPSAGLLCRSIGLGVVGLTVAEMLNGPLETGIRPEEGATTLWRALAWCAALAVVILIVAVSTPAGGRGQWRDEFARRLPFVAAGYGMAYAAAGTLQSHALTWVGGHAIAAALPAVLGLLLLVLLWRRSPGGCEAAAE